VLLDCGIEELITTTPFVQEGACVVE